MGQNLIIYFRTFGFRTSDSGNGTDSAPAGDDLDETPARDHQECRRRLNLR